ncbi:MAG: RNA polymerase subunit sigma [Oscillibacter sp.]|nr:RNA polymerase subunit sigma [Oscillibacter sp.]
MNYLEQEVIAAKTDEQALNSLVENHKQWILRCASEAAHRYITDSDDEWSVALLAFLAAVRGYDTDKGSFRGFAGVVIRRRIVDYLRSEWRHGAEVSVTPGAFDGELNEEEATGTNLQVQSQVVAESMAASDADLSTRTREEIAEIQSTLQRYGFSFFDLTECSPRAEKTKRQCAFAVLTLMGNPVMLEQLRRGRMLPMKELSASSGVSRKILDRHRRYIIAAAEILSGDYPILSAYLDYIRKV